MYDNINILHDVIENIEGGEIPSDGHREQIPVFCTAGFHFVGFGLGPSCPGNLDAPSEEKVYDVGTNKARGTGNEDVARGDSFLARICSTCGRWNSPRSKRHCVIVVVEVLLSVRYSL